MASKTSEISKVYKVYLGLGTNLGDREANLAVGHKLLNERGVRVLAASSIYSTAPWGGVEQPDFLNQVIRVETELPPEELLRVIKQIEADAGRTPTIFWGPRVLDIDILLYDELTFASKGLTIPHREIKNRAFVLVPLAELAPGLVLPDGSRVDVLSAALPQAEKDGVRLWPGGDKPVKE